MSGFMFEQDPSVQRPGWLSTYVRIAVVQVLAVLVGFALLVLLTNVTGATFLRGEVRDLYESWTQFVRPVIGIPLQALADQFPAEYAFKVPIALIDNLIVGLIFSLHEELNWGGWRALLPTSFSALGMTVLFYPLLWPLVLFVFWPTSRLYWGTKRGTIEIGWTLWLPPIAYGMAFLVAGAIVGP